MISSLTKQSDFIVYGKGSPWWLFDDVINFKESLLLNTLIRFSIDLIGPPASEKG